MNARFNTSNSTLNSNPTLAIGTVEMQCSERDSDPHSLEVKGILRARHTKARSPPYSHDTGVCDSHGLPVLADIRWLSGIQSRAESHTPRRGVICSSVEVPFDVWGSIKSLCVWGAGILARGGECQEWI